ncbi:beta strand repeat-containing protein [Chryseobacterium hispalense]|uniref:beta strand repeat-containing protein n=1 Tax=Chryseobacterium hispalense TaxID=1453492 RepID=UPI00391BF9EA
MKKYIYLIFTLLLGIQAFAQGHFPGTVLPATPNTAPWNVYSAAPDQRQNASVTNAQSLALLPTGTNGTDIFAYYTVDTTGYTFYLVYTTNGTVPTKTNGTVVNMSFAAFSSPNRIWGGKIPQQTAGTVVNYVIYVNTSGGTLAAANNRIASSGLGIQSTWTEGNAYYSMIIAPGGVAANLNAWFKADDASTVATTGINVTGWNNSASPSFSFNLTRPSDSNVTYSGTTNLVNFNPGIYHNGNQSYGNGLYNNTTNVLTGLTSISATPSSYHFMTVGRDMHSNTGALRALMGNGTNGNNIGLDLQKDGETANGMNYWSDGVTGTGGSGPLGSYLAGEWTYRPGAFGGGAQSTATVYNNGGTGVGSNSSSTNIPTAFSSQLANQQAQIFGASYNYSAATGNPIYSYVDGYKENTYLTPGASNTNMTDKIFTIGNSGTGENWIGVINEVIAYNAELSAADVQKVNSYLAIKYGITLGQGGNTSSNYIVGFNGNGYDYVNSRGSTIWSTAANAGYNYNIAGIARDDASALNQKQSQSVNSGLQPVIGNVNITNTNPNNTNNFSADLSSLVWGSDAGSTSFAASFGFGGLNNRMTRIWRVQETGTVGTVKVAIPVSQIAGNLTQLNVVVSSDSVFDGSDARTLMTLETLGGVQYYTATVDFTSGQFFTFASFVTAPGGVINALRLWIKPESTGTTTDNTGVSTWTNAAGYNDLFAYQASYRPLYRNNTSNLWNFNPTVVFDGIDDYLLSTSMSPSATNAITSTMADFQVGDPITTIAVANPGSSTSQTAFNFGFDAYFLSPWVTPSGYETYNRTNTLAGDRRGIPTIFLTNHNGTAGYFSTNGVKSLFTSGASSTLNAINYFNFGNEPDNAAPNAGISETIQGAWPEAALYRAGISDSDRNKIESYLAVKWGLTLGTSALPVTYVNSAGSTIWSAVANTYHNNIAGIARDDASALNQKQSQSVNSGLQPVIGNVNITDTNANNTNNFSADLSALIWGSDTGSISFATSFAFGGLTARMTRIWRVQETGTVGTVKVAIPVSQIAGNLTQLNLVVSSDAIFDGSDTRTAMTLETLGGVQYYTATVDFTSGQFFSFAALITAPGGVITNLQLWLKPDAGVSTSGSNVTTWTNQTPKGLSFTQGTTGKQPTLVSNYMNFNPGVSFAASGQEMALSNGNPTLFGVNDPISLFYLGNSSSTSGARTVVEMRNSNGDLPTFEWKGTSFGMDLDGTPFIDNGYSLISTVQANTPYIIGSAFNNTNSGGQIYNMQNGAFMNVRSGNTALSVGSNLFLGGNGSAEYFLGAIPELIGYNSYVTNTTDIQKINTYLAVKYGMTLDQTAPLNYLASNGTTIWWNATTNTGYNNNIAGIARDDFSALNQKQSQSVNSGLQPVIGNVNITNTNPNNTNNFSADLSSLVWGSDTGSTSFATSFGFGGLNNRMTRIWRVQETGTVGTVKVALPVSQLSGNFTQLNLVVSSDATFDGSDARTAMTLETLGGVQYYTATVDFTSGQFFSFAAIVTAPGGVLGSSLWLKADAGTSSTTDNTAISQWNDQSGTSNNATQGTAANQPVYRNNITDNINFNPVVNFDGTNHLMNLNLSLLPTGTTARSLFASYFYNGTNAASNQIISWGATSSATGSVYGMRANPLNIDWGNIAQVTPVVPSSLRIAANVWNGSGNTSSIWSSSSLLIGPANITANTSSSGTARLGANNWGGLDNERFAGRLPEVIVYPFALNTTQRLQVESYLAIKYGSTLGTAATPVSYLASNGLSTFWTGDTTYQNNIAGIARDDFSGLNQKQSQSVNSGLQPVIGNVNITDTNANNTNNFSTDLSALVWGSDTGSTSFGTSFAFGGLTTRMTRIWKVQETGTVGTVKVALPVSQLSGSISQLNLVVSSDATFDGSDIRTAMTLETLGGVQYYTATVDFATGQFFSFAALATAPGGVTSGLSVWFDASSGAFSDAGITQAVNNGKVAQWNNRANNASFLSVNQSNTTRQPDYKTGYVNFNPAIEFFGSSVANQEVLIRNGLVSDLFTSNANSSFMLWSGSAGILSTTNYTNTGDRYDFYASNAGQFGNSSISTTGNLSTWNLTSFVINSTSNLGSVNGGFPYSSTSRSGNLSTAITTDFALGGRPDGQFFSTNYIPEFINYTRVLTNAELNRVNSYLALKYGTTLGTTSNLVNYTASNGSTVFWTGDVSYQNNIAGIARDDASGLTQKQSQSVNSGLQPVIGNVNIADTNANNTNSFAADLSALVWGSDTGSTSFGTSFAFGGLTTRMTRIWRIQETGTVGTVKVALPVSQLSGSISQLNLVVSSDATFDGTDARTAMTLETLGGVQYYTATVDFTSGQFYSFAGIATAPGGVFTGLNLWVKADTGTSSTVDNTAISQWNDQAGSNNAVQATGANQPVYQNNTVTNLNFNPTVVFDGTNDYFQLNSSLLPLGSTARSVIVPFVSSTPSSAISWGANGTNTLYTIRINPIATDFGLSLVQNPGGGTSTNPNMATAVYTGSGGSNTLYQLGRLLGSTSINLNTSSGLAALGADVWTGTYNSFFSGRLPEAITYNRALSANELLRVHSYTALKYGMTLDQTTPQNYLASNSGIIWDASTNTAYNNNIFGILRDDASGLHQKISKSVNSGSVLTISTDTDFTSANSTHAAIGTDLQSLVIGETTGAYTFTGTAVTASGITFGTTEAMARRWKVQDTGGISCINLRFDATFLPALSGNERYYMIVSDDASFTSNVVYKAVTRTGNNIDVSVNFRDNNTSYFTLAKKDLGISAGDLTDVKSGISTIPSAGWKPTLPNTYLEINSNSKGLVVSRVANTAAIVTPIEGMIIYDLSDNTMKVYTGTIWRKLGEYSTGNNGTINIFCN